MNLKERIDDYFFISKEQMEEERVEVHKSNYWWVLAYIIAMLIGSLICLHALVIFK